MAWTNSIKQPIFIVALGVGAVLGGSAVLAALYIPAEPDVISAQQLVTTDKDIPRTADGRPDFSGIWQSLSGADFDLEPHSGRVDAPPGAGVIEGHYIPYQDWALQKKAENFEQRFTADETRLNCFSLGVPRSVYYPEPFQIFQRPRDLTVVRPSGAVRTINTNGTRHPRGPIGFWLGDSRGHWEEDTLVVSVQDFTDQTWLDRAGNFHSENLKVVERWSFIDKDTISYSATLEDENVFTRPWSLEVVLYRHKEQNFRLIENYCYTLPYDEYYPWPAQ